MKFYVNTALTVVSIIVTGLVGLFSVSSSYNIYSLGSQSEKSVAFFVLGPFSPLVLSFNSKVVLTANIDGKNVQNIRIATVIIQNTGRSPITPADIYENISIYFDSPWHIAFVDGQKVASTVPFFWKNVTIKRLWQSQLF